MPKKQRNAFFFFMVEWKRRAESRGCKFPNGLKDVNADPELHKAYKGLTQQEKGVYESMAKNRKIAAQGSRKKRTTLGESIQQLQNQEKKQIEDKGFIDEFIKSVSIGTTLGESIQQLQNQQKNQIEDTDLIDKYIKSVVCEGFQQNDMPNKKFVFIHVNWIFQEVGIDEYDYFPTEYAVSIFSIVNGIEDTHHEIINAKTPVGYTREAMDTSCDTHQIPVKVSWDEDNFAIMYDRFVTFLQPIMSKGKFPPLFTTDAIFNPAVSLIKRMAHAAGHNHNKFHVYSLDTLFSNILRCCYQQEGVTFGLPNMIAHRVFQKDVFSHTKGLECDFHKNLQIDSAYQDCSKSIVKQWGYTICDHFNIEVIEEVHTPHSITGSTESSLNKSISVPRADDSWIKLVRMSEINGLNKTQQVYDDRQQHLQTTNKLLQTREYNVVDACKRPLRRPKTQPFSIFKVRNRSPNLNEVVRKPFGERGLVYKR